MATVRASTSRLCSASSYILKLTSIQVLEEGKYLDLLIRRNHYALIIEFEGTSEANFPSLTKVNKLNLKIFQTIVLIFFHIHCGLQLLVMLSLWLKLCCIHLAEGQELFGTNFAAILALNGS